MGAKGGLMPIFIGGPLVSVSPTMSMTHLSVGVNKYVIEWN